MNYSILELEGGLEIIDFGVLDLHWNTASLGKLWFSHLSNKDSNISQTNSEY